MQSTVGIDQLRELLGLMVFDSANEPVGTVKEVVYEEATNWPVWIGVAAAPSATSRIVTAVRSIRIATSTTLVISHDRCVGTPGVANSV